jgi:hypothetical protein
MPGQFLEKKLHMGAYGLPKSAQTEQGEPSRQCHSPFDPSGWHGGQDIRSSWEMLLLATAFSGEHDLVGRNPSRPLDELKVASMQRA